MLRREAVSLARAALLLAATACAATPVAPPKRDPMVVDPKLAAENPRSAAKIAESAFAYFRYTNRPFVDRVCARWASTIPSMPTVHEHGDAHLEQYAVAEDSRGLADYDASALGPPIVDLARFSTSLVLAWPADPNGARSAVDAFMTAYARALDDPQANMPEPAAAARLRARFAPTRREWLDRMQRLIVPPRPEDLPRYRDGWNELVAQVRAQDPSIDPRFFALKVGGMLDMGIGSAHTEKFLARIEGPTTAPDDDVIIEAKAVDEGALGTCMRGADLGAVRIIRGQAQISRAPQRFLAAVNIHGRPFYSHAWLVHYTELAIGDVRSSTELAELAQDVGLQLGRGHAKLVDESNVPAQREALKRTAREIAPTLGEASIALAREVEQAWTTYRRSLAH